MKDKLREESGGSIELILLAQLVGTARRETGLWSYAIFKIYFEMLTNYFVILVIFLNW